MNTEALRTFRVECTIRAQVKTLYVTAVDAQDAERQARLRFPYCKHIRVIGEPVRARDDIA